MTSTYTQSSIQRSGSSVASVLLNRFNLFWLTILVFIYAFLTKRYFPYMEISEHLILLGSFLTLFYVGLKWRELGICFLSIFLGAAFNLWFFSINNNNILAAQTNFFLKFFFSSESAIMWMNVLLILATLFYGVFSLNKKPYIAKLANAFVWISIAFGLIGLLGRWNESYLINIDYGHIPISNLYEVFILFVITSSILYLYYEKKFNLQFYGFFILLINCFSICFILWYSFYKGANEIQPLVPALKSYWMKIHVPTNFIAYACFSIAAMLGCAFLLKDFKRTKLSSNQTLQIDSNNPHALPPGQLLTIMHRSISLGFFFFTIATILGSIWAAEAWGSYWSWDPKETWALIVWLNYAAWLHARMNLSLSEKLLAWWSIIGLLITAFAFMGVNLFLSGLHSYGEL